MGVQTLENAIITSLHVNSFKFTYIRKYKHKTQNIGALHTNLLLVYLRFLFHQTKTAS